MGMKIIYEDEDVIIKESDPWLIYPYHKTEYYSPLFHIVKTNWLCCGCWSFHNGEWHKQYSDKTAATIDEVVSIIKQN